MARVNGGAASFGGPANDLLPVLALPAHQVQAAIDPAMPLRALADVAYEAETAGRPIRIWGREPSLARRLNDARASSDEDRPTRPSSAALRELSRC